MLSAAITIYDGVSGNSLLEHTGSLSSFLLTGDEAIPEAPEQRHDRLSLATAGVHDLGHDVLAEDADVEVESELAKLDDKVEDLEEAVNAGHYHPYEYVHLVRLEHIGAVLLHCRVSHFTPILDLEVYLMND